MCPPACGLRIAERALKGATIKKTRVATFTSGREEAEQSPAATEDSNVAATHLPRGEALRNGR